MDMEENIEELIRIYASSSKNLRQVAALAAEEDPNGVVSLTSRAKANTYDVVIDDLKDILAGKGN
jgi:hypothetical protein